ncbi:MAG: hypothetical protein ACFFG0_14620 [Candidatus Thorarchaeota archaeon]
MSFIKEKDLYSVIKDWLKNLLKSYYPRKKIDTYDTSSVFLSKFIQDSNWMKYRDDYATYQIKIDILGVLIYQKNLDFVFVEVKNTKISLKDISQLIGYSRVAKPLYSFIISPKWVSDPVRSLFEKYRRFDILTYDKNRIIKIVKWDCEKRDIDFNYIYPKSELI